MGQAKSKQRAAFSPAQIHCWEETDCVNFAVALARMTGWLLHVDWWSTSTQHREDIPIEELRPLRVYVADNHDRVFDVRGIKTIMEFNESVIRRKAQQAYPGNGCVYTRYYAEDRLASLPLRVQPDPLLISLAADAVRGNVLYLAAIPARMMPCIPAHQAARYSYGACAAFAEAMREVYGLRATALLATRFSPMFEGTKRGKSGYFHSVVLHDDGTAEDAWGRGTLESIAARFGAVEFEVSVEEHLAVLERFRQTSSEAYGNAFNDAVRLIRSMTETSGAGEGT
ncbi:hypothetical protein KY495_20730 [Massilia sp. PAMC28688]|uniref:hypothetical protein n=1 Tax=Massilia sp. PAMC28688 TaxID=2861283 RepID=UPI001C630E1E|nr:hypothetical protein [Massilia sp. PAMC28688]QYF93091.1 hypothetical protein KY495_20730 [Massilia sp. PAMC28688]